ncbi:MAG: hypothetical protein ACU83O_02045 [Gammaproteobacteria bacterium]
MNKCSILVIIISLCLALFWFQSEIAIRYVGLLFQEIGIITVIWGIWDTQESFGLPSFRSKMIDKAKTFISKTKSSLFGSTDRLRQKMTGHFNSYYDLNAYGPHEKYEPLAFQPAPKLTLETLAEILKENVNSIQERISQTQKEMNREFEKIDCALKREEQTRITEDTATRKKLEIISMGGFDISITGVVFLSVGAFLSTTSNEIYKNCLEAQWCSESDEADILIRPIPDLIPGINTHLTNKRLERGGQNNRLC